MANEVSINELDKALQTGKVLVALGAPWCPDCVRVQPYLDTLSKEFEGKVSIYKIMINQIGELDPSLNIRKIPTLIFFKNGEEVGERLIEPPTIDPIRKALEELANL